MKIFISYKRENRSFAETLRNHLKAWGYDTWMDIDDIPSGAYWPDAIDIGLRAADVIIGLMSPAAVESRNVKNEWDWAIMNNKRLILLRVQPCYIPMNYVSINYIVCDDPETGFARLRQTLADPAVPGEKPSDPYQDYLQNLYQRINIYLGQKIILSLRDEAGLPEPVRLKSDASPEAIDALFAEKQVVDPLFEIGGIASGKNAFADFREAFEQYNGRVLLLGEPGAGKTITLLQFGRDAVVRRMQDSSLPLPVLGIISTWNPEVHESLSVWLGHAYGAPSSVERLIEQGRVLLLLDGLDELGGERPVNPDQPDGEKFDPRQQFAALIPMNNQIVLSCRDKDYMEMGEKLPLNGAVTLRKLEDDQLHLYLQDYPDLWQVIQRDTTLQELVRNPLLLSLITFAFADQSHALQTLQNLSQGELRDHIFEQYVKQRFEHEKRKPYASLLYPYEKMVSLLQGVAFLDAIADSQNQISYLYFHQMVGYEPDDFIQQVIQLNLIVPSDAEHYQFIHLKLRDYLAFPRLLYKLFEDDTVWSRYRMIRALGDMGDARALDSLLRCLQDGDENIRSAAVYAVGKIGAGEAVEPLIDALHDNRARVRTAAADVLGKMGDGRAVLPLAGLAKDGDKVVRGIAVEALSRMTDANAIESLIAIFADENPAVRQAAERALTTIGQPAVQPLIQALQHEALCPMAALTLGGIKDPTAINPLINLLSDETQVTFTMRICDFAAQALDNIGTPEALAALDNWHSL